MANIGRIIGNAMGLIGGATTGAVVGGSIGGPGGAVVGAVAGLAGGGSLNTLARHRTRGSMGFDAWDPSIKEWINGIDAASGTLQREYGKAIREFNGDWSKWAKRATDAAKKLDIDVNDIMHMSKEDLLKNNIDINGLKDGTFAGQRAFLIGSNSHRARIEELSDRIKDLQGNMQSATGRKWTKGKAASATSLAEDNMFLDFVVDENGNFTKGRSQSDVTGLMFEIDSRHPYIKDIEVDKYPRVVSEYIDVVDKDGKPVINQKGPYQGQQKKKPIFKYDAVGNPIVDKSKPPLKDQNGNILKEKRRRVGYTHKTTNNYVELTKNIAEDGTTTYSSRGYTIGKDNERIYSGEAKEITESKYNSLIGKSGSTYKGNDGYSEVKVSPDGSSITSYVYGGGEGSAYSASMIGLPQQKEGWRARGNTIQSEDAEIVAAQIAQARTGDSDGIGLIGAIKEHPFAAMTIAAGGAAILANQRAERQGTY